MLRYWWPSELVNSAAPIASIPPSPGFVIYNDAHIQSEPERHLAWRRWLWLFNIFQTLPGILLATQPGLDAGDHEGLSVSSNARASASAAGAAYSAAWETVIEQAMGSLSEGLRALLDAGLPPPDEVGYELDHAGDVVAEAELAWTKRKLVLLMPAHTEGAPVWQANGWRTLMAEDDWQKRLTEELGNNSVKPTTQDDIQQEVHK
jgi:DEAD/DEAH box helicase domain-containing protein